jgi:hypothetical protein
MRSRAAVTVPVTSTRWRPGTRHRMLGDGSAGHAGPAMRAPRREYPAIARRPDTARAALCLKAVRTFTPACRYGMSPSPSGYLASEHVT